MKEIENIVRSMDVPEVRISDLGWLSRNLGIRNSSHPKFDEIMKLIKDKFKNRK